MRGQKSPSGTNEEEIPRDTAQDERLVFERLVADPSVRFANVFHDGIVAEIETALGRLVKTLGYDRCTYSEPSRPGRRRHSSGSKPARRPIASTVVKGRK